MSALRVRSEGDEALRFAAREPAEREPAALRLHRALLARPPACVVDWIHAPESVLVLFDCTAHGPDEVAAAVLALPAAPPGSARRVELAMIAGGPDAASAAESAGTDVAGLLDRLAATEFTVAAVGSSGLPLLRADDWDLRVPRLASPRTAVPPGSIGLAGDRVCVYPVAMPGGWRLVARTPVALVDLHDDPPVRLAAGDRVRFRAVGEEEAAALAGTAPWTRG